MICFTIIQIKSNREVENQLSRGREKGGFREALYKKAPPPCEPLTSTAEISSLRTVRGCKNKLKRVGRDLQLSGILTRWPGSGHL